MDRRLGEVVIAILAGLQIVAGLGSVSSAAGVPDSERALTSYLGGELGDSGTALAGASDGSLYVAGDTSSSFFPSASSVSYIGDPQGSQSNLFIARIDSDGSLREVAVIGGSDFESLADISVTSDQVVVVGATSSSDFPSDPSPKCPEEGCSLNGFVIAMNRSLESILWAKVVGGSRDDQFTSVYGGRSSVLVAGHTFSDDFPVRKGLQMERRGKSDFFVLRLDETGRTSRGTYLGGYGAETFPQIDMVLGSPVLVGTSTSKAYPSTWKGKSSATGYSRGVVSRLGSSLGSIKQSFLIGASGNVAAFSLAAHDGRLYLGGSTSGPWTHQISGASAFDEGCCDGFLMKVNLRKQEYSWVRRVGGSSEDQVFSVSLSRATGHIAVGGRTNSSDLQTRDAAQSDPGSFGCEDSPACYDGFVARIDSGGRVQTLSYLGGSDFDSVAAISAWNGGFAATGETSSSDFPIRNAFQSMLLGPRDAFVSAF